MFSRLVFGTAQLGMNYGIANKTGKPDMQMARDMVQMAWEGGIRYFDTAQAYGDSERILGDIFSDLGISRHARVITKPDPYIDHTNKKDLEDALSKSLSNLKLERLYGLMLHKEDFLDLFETGLSDILQYFIDQGFVEHIGVSLYSPAKAFMALEKVVISMVQVPANICDHRFYETGIFNLAERKGSEIYVRSVFLQGLLLMGKDTIPEGMQFAAPVIDKVKQLCQEFNVTRQELALSYIRQKYPQAFVVIGAETQQQLADNLAAWNRDQAIAITAKADAIFADVDERIINPILWSH